MIQIQKIIFTIGFMTIMFGMIVVVSSTSVFGSYALWYVGQNMSNRILAPQQIFLLIGFVILIGCLYMVVKSKFTLSTQS